MNSHLVTAYYTKGAMAILGTRNLNSFSTKLSLKNVFLSEKINSSVIFVILIPIIPNLDVIHSRLGATECKADFLKRKKGRDLNS